MSRLYSIIATIIMMTSSMVVVSPVSAAQDFFESLYDVPMMTGMIEIEEEALNFDKPSGRISKAAGYINASNEAVIETYYNDSLPQMGWQKTDKLTYIRAQEQLKINISKSEAYEDNIYIVSFYIEPAL